MVLLPILLLNVLEFPYADDFVTTYPYSLILSEEILYMVQYRVPLFYTFLATTTAQFDYHRVSVQKVKCANNVSNVCKVIVTFKVATTLSP